MELKEKIYSVNKEASLYKSQGMYEEALDKYKELLELVLSFSGLKNKEELKAQISQKIVDIEKKLNFYDNKSHLSGMSSDKKEIIKKLFASKTDDPDYNRFEQALTLAKFGQFEDAIKEMTPFLSNSSLRQDAVINILKCYKALDQKSFINGLLDEWKSKGIISEAEYGNLSEKDSKKGSGLDNIEENQDDFSETESPEIMEIDSVGIKLSGPGVNESDPIELDVSFQTGNHLSLIISSREKKIIDNLDVGLRLNDMCFYSPMAVFKSSGIVLSKHQISSGPKKGDWCLDIEIKNPS